jgi:L-2,4-diaminobutyrate transaminase
MIARAMPQGDILGFAPPLTISKHEVEKVVAITKSALEDVTKSLSGADAA